nr:zinc finger protein [Haemonchus contortus]
MFDRFTAVSIDLDQQQELMAATAAVSPLKQQVDASTPLYSVQFAGNTSASDTPTCTNYVSTLSHGNRLPKKEENPFSIEGHMLDGNTEKPYTLVLTHSCKVQSEADAVTVRRSRGRNITSETFVCMHRAQPMFVEQKGNLSMYSNWHQVNINETESKLNLLYMGMCSTRPRTGVKPFWRYSVANRDHGQYKMTHSSFWEYRHKVKRHTDEAQTLYRKQEVLHFLGTHEQDTKLVVDEANSIACSTKINCKDCTAVSEELTFANANTTSNLTRATVETMKPSRTQSAAIGGYRTDEARFI